MVACILWSSAFAAIKIGLDYIQPFCFAGIRFMLAGLLLVPLWLAERSRIVFDKHMYITAIKVAVLQTFVLYGLFYYAISRVSGAVAAIIIGSSPIVSALVAHYVCRDDKINRLKFICMFIGFAGIVMVVLARKPFSANGISELWGISVLLLGSVVSALASIVVSEDQKKVNPVFLNSFQLFFGGLMLFFVSLFVEGMPVFESLDIKFYGILFWLSFLSAAAFSIWFYLLQHDNVKVSELNFWKFLIPVLGAGLSWILLPTESPNFWMVCGMASVTFSVIWYNRMSAKELVLVRNDNNE